MFLAVATLLSGLALSSVAIYYSVLGLAAIFSAKFVQVVIMGVSLEVSKLVIATWLKANWSRIPSMMKWYMTFAVIVLMLITSMGIFGFLSRAHSEQSLVSANNSALIQELDRKISIEERTISGYENVITQMDSAVQQLIDANRLRGPNGSIAIRQSQAEERNELTALIESSNARISEYQSQKMPLIEARNNLEAEVGPIKYIAQFVYGENPSNDVLEKAVSWVIIILVFVFDPLAVLLLISAQMSFKWKSEVPTVKKEEVNVDNNELELYSKLGIASAYEVYTETLCKYGGSVNHYAQVGIVSDSSKK